MLSRKALYAIRALVTLAEAWPQALATPEVVGRNGLPRKFLEAILTELKAAGVTTSTRGRGGGHALARPPAEITLAEIVRLTNGPLALMPCASVTAFAPCHDCEDVDACRIRAAFARGRDALAAAFEGTSLADLAKASD